MFLSLPSPCFATTAGQLLVSSSVELGRELIDSLERETEFTRGAASTSEAWRTRLYAPGVASLLEAIGDQLQSREILEQAIDSDHAKKQVAQFIDGVRKLGMVQLTSEYGRHDFRLDLRISLPAHSATSRPPNSEKP
jgi:hypothetical protein